MCDVEGERGGFWRVKASPSSSPFVVSPSNHERDRGHVEDLHGHSARAGALGAVRAQALVCLSAVLVGLAPGDAAAAANVKVTAAPALVFLRLAERAPGVALEERLAGELGLALDGVAVFSVPPPEPGFAQKSLPLQLAAVQGVVREYAAVAAVWFAETDREGLVLHLVALDTGRTVVRSLTKPQGPRPEGELALAVRELLGTAYLFGTPEQRLPPMVAVVVDELKQRLAAEVASAPTTKAVEPAASADSGRWALSAAALLRAPVSDDERSALESGVTLAAAWRSAVGLELGALVEGARPTPTRGGAHEVSGWSTAAGLALGHRGLAVGAFALSPAAAALLELRRLRSTSPAKDVDTFTATGLVLEAGLRGRYRASEHVGVLLAPGVLYRPQRLELRRRSDGALVAAAPTWAFMVALGVEFDTAF